MDVKRFIQESLKRESIDRIKRNFLERIFLDRQIPQPWMYKS